MKNKYTIAYIGAIIAIPVALLFIVPAVATTHANVWDFSGTFGNDASQAFAQAQADANAVATSWGSDATASADAQAAATAAATGGTSGSATAYSSGSASASATVNGNTCGQPGCPPCPQEPAPTCDLDILPSTIYVGDTVQLVWNTDNATAVSIAGIGSVALDGSRTLSPTQSRSYTLTATGAGGVAQCSKTVGVLPREQNYPAPTCTFDISPASITAGGATTMTWHTTNANAVSIENLGSVSVNGSMVVHPTQSRNYILTATGNGGSVTCTDSVQVTPVQTTVRCDSFTASHTSIGKGNATVLNWATTGATEVSISPSVGTVSLDGNKTVNLFQDTTFTLTARNGSITDTCQLSIDVTEDITTTNTSTTTNTNVNNNYNTNVNNNYNTYSGGGGYIYRNFDSARCNSFTVSDTRVEKGDTVTLKWRTTDADDVDINQGIGRVDDDGSEDVRVYRDTTFILTARNSSGNGSSRDTCRVTVNVDGDNNSNGSSAPRCVLTVSDNTIYAGQNVLLSWVNERTDRLVLKEGSKTIVDSKKDKNIDEDVDSVTINPTKSTKYTLDVYNGNKKETCTLDVNVGAGLVSGISLSQVPYTGFDAGPMLTYFFYGAIVLWGVVMAYILVLKKKNRTQRELA